MFFVSPLKFMTMIFDAQGHQQKLEYLSAVERLCDLKEKSGSDPFPVIKECFNIWNSTNPKQYKSYIIHLNDIKKSRKTTTVGSKRFRGVSKDNDQGGFTSYIMDIPEKIVMMIRCLYDSEELPMDKEFYYQLGKRFPELLIREKV